LRPRQADVADMPIEIIADDARERSEAQRDMAPKIAVDGFLPE
jgi:hypothetical protein